MKKLAFTLIEVLSSIAIVAILASIVLPAYSSGKRSAFRTSDIANLRQVGISFELYTSDYSHSEYSATRLVKNGYCSKDVLSSMLDPTREGISNIIARNTHISLPHFDEEVLYRVSYPSFTVYGQFNETFTVLEGFQNIGWLVSIAEVRPLFGDYNGFFEGSYLRLKLDGSVMSKQSVWGSSNFADFDGRVYSPYMLFADISENEFRKGGSFE